MRIGPAEIVIEHYALSGVPKVYVRRFKRGIGLMWRRELIHKYWCDYEDTFVKLHVVRVVKLTFNKRRDDAEYAAAFGEFTNHIDQ